MVVVSRRSQPGSQRAFAAAMAALFAASVAVTVIWCGAMSGMAGMRMPGGWTMSMAWMRMPGQSWPAAATSFLGMWLVMMVAMMLPSLAPMLWRYRRSVGAVDEPRLSSLTTCVAAAYFLVWAVLGAVLYPLGVALAAAWMRWPALAAGVPAAVGAIVVMVGLLQFTPWKLRHLACCRGALAAGIAMPPVAAAAWRHGLRLGFHCACCCGGLMLILLVVGVMDLAAMAVVTAAITVERLLPAGEGVARGIGVAVVGAGAYLMMP